MKTRKKQFKKNPNPLKCFDRKIQRTRTSLILSVTKVIPDSWSYVRLTPLEAGEDKIVLEVKKLLAVNNNARTNESIKGSGKDT